MRGDYNEVTHGMVTGGRWPVSGNLVIISSFVTGWLSQGVTQFYSLIKLTARSDLS